MFTEQELIIRRASISAAEDLVRVHVASWQWAYKGLMPDEFLAGLSVQARFEKWRTVLREENADRRVWAAAQGTQLVGFAVTDRFEPGTRIGEVNSIYLEENAAGKGIGRSLLSHAIDDLRARGFEQVKIWVLALNERARKFYQRAGFEPDGASRVEQRANLEFRDVRYSKFVVPQPPVTC